MVQSNLLLALVSTGVVLLDGSAYAQVSVPAPQEPLQPSPAQAPIAVFPRDAANRHTGFFIRPDIGLGYASSSASSGTTSVTISGMAGFAGVSIGGAVTENLILAGRLYAVVVNNPTVSVNGVSASTSNAQASMSGLGPELTYYFVPANVYLSACLAMTKQSTEQNGVQTNTEIGVGAEFAVGKEWWVSSHWGLGLAGRVSVSANKDTGATNAPTWDALGVAALFSASYN